MKKIGLALLAGLAALVGGWVVSVLLAETLFTSLELGEAAIYSAVLLAMFEVAFCTALVVQKLHEMKK